MERKYKCHQCGTIKTERWMRKVARMRKFTLSYTPPCPNCSCSDWTTFEPNKVGRAEKATLIVA